MGSVVEERAKDPWIEQLTKAVQQVNQQLSQAKDHAVGPTVVAMTRQSRLLIGMIGVRIDRWARLSPARLATVDVLTVAEGHIARNCYQVRLPKPSDPYAPFV